MSEKLASSAPPPPPPRPAAAPPKQSRRRFLTIIAVVGGLLALAPWVPFGNYLSASVGGSSSLSKNQKIVLDLGGTSGNGSAGGKAVNVNDLTSFPPNSHWVMTYPSSGDPSLDGQNPNTFVKFDLIRLPTELGGSNKDASAFVAFSKVCVHLWCSPNYGGGPQNPPPEHRDYECPCHGSLYSVGENAVPVGVAFKGPAAVQPPPTNAIPMLTLAADSAGNLEVVPPVWDIDHNGVIGYGRNVGNGAFTGGYNPQ
jgi:rieske iron-sulfur protein